MPSGHRCTCEPVGLADVAGRLGLPATRVKAWHHRAKRGESVPVPWPPARWDAASGPLWCWRLDFEPIAEQFRGKQAEHP